MTNKNLARIGTTTVVECHCGSHFYKFTLYDTGYDQDNPELIIDFLEPNDGKIRGRIGWAWRILRRGYYGKASIELTLEDRDLLVEHLQNPVTWGENFYEKEK